jgi:hypothetical protein
LQPSPVTQAVVQVFSDGVPCFPQTEITGQLWSLMLESHFREVIVPFGSHMPLLHLSVGPHAGLQPVGPVVPLIHFPVLMSHVGLPPQSW